MVEWLMKVSLWVRESALGADICNDVLYVLWACIVTSGQKQVFSDEEAILKKEMCCRRCIERAVFKKMFSNKMGSGCGVEICCQRNCYGVKNSYSDGSQVRSKIGNFEW